MNHADKSISFLPANIRSSVVRSLLAVFSLMLFLPSASGSFEINAERHDGVPVTGFHWQVVEDSTHAVVPGTRSGESLSFAIHRSSNRVVASGHAAGSSATVSVPEDRRYFVSAVPDIDCPLFGGATCSAAGGAQVNIGDQQVTVRVASGRIPAAQITVRVFEDTRPLNGQLDLPGEAPNSNGNAPMAGYTIQLDDTYARVQQDVFGNLLGTTYVKNPDGAFAEDEFGDPVVETVGTGIILTDANGSAVIKNLYPGKYGVNAVSPGGEHWQQTTTIEGKKTIDAWVKANEPAFFQEFGIPGPHVKFGFVREMLDGPGPSNPIVTKSPTTTLTGSVVSNHATRAPDYQFSPGMPIANCWVGLNDLSVGAVPGEAIYIAACDEDSGFSIPNVAEGSYTLAIFDTYLDVVFASYPVQVFANPPATTDLGQVKVFQWFGRTEHYVFFDSNEDGFPDPGEPGMPEQGVNLRHRDGTIYQSFPTDLGGTVPFDEVFPFFHWLVAEVDFLRFKATGLTVMVDGGGLVDPNPVLDAWIGEPTDELMAMQPQPENGGAAYRTETGEVLTQAVQTFLGSTNRFFWGKGIYGPGENGGISGVMLYGVTRAEDDPAYAAAEEWEPGVARAVINLYQDSDADGIIDDLNGDGPTVADVDNYPFDNFPSVEDLDHNFNFAFDAGDAIAITSTDSWDDSLPTGCVGAAVTQSGFPTPDGGVALDCFEGLRTYNQVRPAVFDGGYAFGSYFPGGIESGSVEVDSLEPGTYIVEGIAPALYHTVAEEDKNVDFGDLWTPGTLLLPPACVGDLHTVPAKLNLFKDGIGVDAPFAGLERPSCGRKQVTLKSGGFNAAADFFVTTHVPLPGRAVGIVLNDLANEFDANSPNFSEKFAPSWVPIAAYDWKQDQPFSRVYSDEYGAYNLLIPSTYNINLPSPSGVSPWMSTICINDPGPIPDPDNPGAFITDPYYNPQYSKFCYTFNFHSGTTTYLDTPVVPSAAFAMGIGSPVDCEPKSGTPKLRRVDGPGNVGPIASSGDIVTISSMGYQQVRNPAFELDGAESMLVYRDFGFGIPRGTVSIGGVDIPPANLVWGNAQITFEVPSGTQSGTLLVTRGDNDETTDVGITLTIDNSTGLVLTVPQGGSIQATIDAASAGDIVMVPSGVYNENVIVDRSIRLQGYGAGSTVISGTNLPTSRAVEWRAALLQKLAAGDAGLLPNQEGPGAPTVGWESGMVAEESPAVIFVPSAGEFAAAGGEPRLDGFSIVNAEIGGGVLVNGHAEGLEISNNEIARNVGVYGGGIRVGLNGLLGIVDGQNDNISIHNNAIVLNAGIDGPGGIAIYTGADSYSIEDNLVCGNHTGASGAGIGHIGLSQDGLIKSNTITFNEAWHGTNAASGGGIHVAGMAPQIVGNPANSPMTDGSGDLKIVDNVIQGNSSGTGDGAAINLKNVNGEDVVASPNDASGWWEIGIFNNIIVNNVAGNAGALALKDAPRVAIVNNTIANNDSTATAATALNTDLLSSNPRGAGVVSYKHTAALRQAISITNGPFSEDWSQPTLINNIIWHNRSFSWQMNAAGTSGALTPDFTNPNYHDLEVWGTNSQKYLNPNYSVLSDIGIAGAGYDDGTNVDGDPDFVDPYFNGPRGVIVETEFSAQVGPLLTAVAFDEGGNFIDIDFGPLTQLGDYHIDSASSAANVDGDATIVGQYSELGLDIDGDPRGTPNSGWVDAGADEYAIATSNLCGLGFEAALIVPLLQWSLRSRRKKHQVCDGLSSLEELGQ